MSRSHKEKRSSYAPEKGVRYDGVYRIEKCWRKVGIQVKCAILFFWNCPSGLLLLTDLLIWFPSYRALRSAGICLLDVTMNLPHGRGLCLVNYLIVLFLLGLY